MKMYVFLCLAALLLQGCKNLPAAGWYERTGSGDRVYALYIDEEPGVMAKFPGAFTKQDFIIALGRSPSSQYMTAGRPRYYTVLSDNPDKKSNLQLITLEILERDYQRSKK
jgi:hypothetical protein